MSRRRIAASLLAAGAYIAAMGLARGADEGTGVPTLHGGSGLYRVSTAEVGARGEIRLAMHLEYARSTDFLIAGDVNHRTEGLLAAGVTVHRNVELFAVIQAIDNYNRSGAGGSTGDVSVNELHGAALAGVKLAASVAPSFALGVEVGGRAPTDVDAVVNAASAWVAALGSVNLAAGLSLPLRLHADVGYIEDNSRRQVDLTGLPMSTRQRVAFAYGMGASRFRMAVGVDAPLLAARWRLGVWPLAEYHFEYVTAPPDPAFRNQSPYNRDQQWLTVGVRMKRAGVVLNGGVDVLLRSPGYIHGPPLQSYNIVIGVAVPVRL